MRQLSFLILPFLLSACSLGGLFPEATATMPPSPTVTQTPTSTATATSTATPAPTETPTATPTPVCAFPAGNVEQTGYSGYLVREQVPVRIYLPPCYEVSNEVYPVVIMLHGYPMDQTHLDILGADEAAADGILNRGFPPVIVVMPYQPQPLFSNSSGGPWSYEAEFMLGLLPWLESSYRIDPAPEKKVIAGISRGAIWALEIGFSYPDTFGTVAALSPALAVNQPAPQYDPFNLAVAGRGLPARIYLMAGEGDWARWETERLLTVLENGGFQPTYVLVPGIHDDSIWRGLMPDLMAYLVSDW